MISYSECSARERLQHVLDGDSFHEWLPPSQRLRSPHLAQLGAPSAFDAGVAIGRARLAGSNVFVAAQEGNFMGGGVGEVHGAKLVGMLRRAAIERPVAVLLFLESGGVRLHEANAGLIAVSEVMRAVLDLRAAGVPVVALIGGRNGCFGGMGIVAACADRIVMSDVGRLSMSGPEVIEASNGVAEFDSRDRALIWRTTGGRHRWLTGDCAVLIEDETEAFRVAAIKCLGHQAEMSLANLEHEHRLMRQRLHDVQQTASGEDEAVAWWTRLGVPNRSAVPDVSVAELRASVQR